MICLRQRCLQLHKIQNFGWLNYLPLFHSPTNLLLTSSIVTHYFIYYIFNHSSQNLSRSSSKNMAFTNLKCCQLDKILKTWLSYTSSPLSHNPNPTNLLFTLSHVIHCSNILSFQSNILFCSSSKSMAFTNLIMFYIYTDSQEI